MQNRGIKENDKIFIAGSKGMVGNSICRVLKKSAFGSNNPEIKLLTPSKTELDLTDNLKVNYWFKENKPDITILAAAKVGGILSNSKYPTEFLLENLKIQNNVIEASFKNNVRRFLFLGSSCIYPKLSPQPIKEEYLLGSYLEKTNQWYALAKIAGLKLCEALRTQYGFDTISLMPTNLYGQGDNYDEEGSHVIPALIRKIYFAKKNNQKNITCWGSGKPLREFVYVDDLAEACLYALNNWFPSTNDEIKWLNVGSNNEISIKELALKISKKLNYKGNILWDKSRPDGTMRKKLDTTRFSKIGWEAKINLDEGLNKTIKHFLKEIEIKTIRF